MVKFFEHRQLAAKGLTCGKTRRRAERGKLINELESGLIIRILIFLGIIGAFAGLIFIAPDPARWTRFFTAVFMLIAGLTELYLNDPETEQSNSRLTLIFGTILVQLLIFKIIFAKTIAGNIDASIAPLLLPYVFAPLALAILLGKNGGLFATIFATLLATVIFKNFILAHLILSLATGFVVVMTTRRVRRRSRIIRAGIYAGFSTWIIAILLELISPIDWTSLENSNCSLFIFQSAIAIGIGIATAIIVSGLLPILEWLFRVTTDISWIEMADLNHQLLRRLSLEAPGTYQHSLAMASLSESAAEAIGANPTICRVGAYFHDIGKLIKPEYFTENISSDENPHDALTPTMSALIISAHIKEGVDLALKNRLNPRVIDIIRQHHGTTMVGYFFYKACQHQKDARLGGEIMKIRPEDIPAIDPGLFRYPGPKPQTKEAAIVGLADAAESASRSIDRPTPQRIEDLMKSILEGRLQDGQYDECPITISELHKVVASLVASLTSMLHTRVSYKKRFQNKEEFILKKE
ncbi:MAG: HDIG domain-containing metalloprotein [Chthoniobacterales bacterium]